MGLLTTAGCNGSSNGGPGTPVAAAIAVEPVHLAPGVTSAALSWEPSEGPTANYFIFESRNDSAFAFSQMTTENQATIAGQPGDQVRITVIGVSKAGDTSKSSPPSPPLIFHAATASAATQLRSPALAAPSVTPEVETAGTQDASAAESTSSASEEATRVANSAEETSAESDVPTTRLDHTLRSLLLGGDARLPERGLSDHAHLWLQQLVDDEIAAGVSLAGTGRQNADALRDLVWQDQAGQLFVSDGRAFLDADDLPSTLGEALRLRATERFVGLADFDGDGRGDWLVEDAATGDVWVVDGSTGIPVSAAPRGESRLAGHGDFDGDGRAELLWSNDDYSDSSGDTTHTIGRFEITQPIQPAADDDSPSARSAAGFVDGPAGFELLAVADLNGDGLDDLLGRGAAGGIVLALSRSGDSVEWRAGSSSITDGLDLLATVDVDDDGAAEIAFLNGDVLEIWSAESGLRDSLRL